MKWKFHEIMEPQIRPPNTIVVIMGTPKRVPLILGDPQVTFVRRADPSQSRFAELRATSSIYKTNLCEKWSAGSCKAWNQLPCHLLDSGRE